MINRELKNITQFIKYLELLGFEKKIVKISKGKFKEFYEHDCCQVEFFVDIYYVNVILIHCTSYTEYKGYEEVIDFLNIRYKNTFRKLKIKKLLDDKQSN